MATYSKYETSKGEFWQVRGYLGLDDATGLEQQFSKRGFKTKKEARSAYERAKTDFLKGIQALDNRHLTYEQVYHEWLENYTKDVKESTAHATIRIFELYILPEIGKIKIDKLHHRRLQRLVNEWHEQYKKYKKIFNYMNNVLNYAYRMNYIKENPTKRVIVPKPKRQEKKDDTVFYTRQELETFMQALYQETSLKWVAFFRLLAFTGIRRSEALALTWGDIDFKNQLLKISKTLSIGYGHKVILSDSPKTEDSERIITLDPKTCTILKQWKHEQAEKLIGFGYNAINPKQLLFNKWESNSYLNLSAPRNAMTRICKKHGLKQIKIHGFRHTHCSLLFEAGVPMKDVKERLGHSNIQTTMDIYTHVTKESRDKSAQLFAKYANF